MKKLDSNIVGYVFGYKESVTEKDGSFIVKFINGTSTNFPKKYKDKRDFYCFEIKNGDVHNLYINAEDFHKDFEEKININKRDYDLECINNIYNENKYKFSFAIDFEQFFYIYTIYDVISENAFCHKSFENEETKKEIINKYLLKLLKNPNDTLNEYMNILKHDYEESLNQFSQEFKF